MKQYLFEIAKKTSKKSNCKTKLGAVLVRGSRVLAVAANTEGSSGKGEYLYSRHAEASLFTGRRKFKSEPATVYVFRAHARTNKSLLSKPCGKCQRRMVKAGVTKVFYTTEDGWGEMDLR